MQRLYALGALSFMVVGCDSLTSSPAGSGTVGVDAGSSSEVNGTAIPAEPQRAGDPSRGYSALVNEGIVACGIPWTIYSRFFGAAPEGDRLPGRTRKNANLPFGQTAFTTSAGVEVVSANCLTCHAGHINGQLIVGLGNTEQDYTTDPSSNARTARGIASQLTSDPKEIAELQKWASRVEAVGPYSVLDTVGPNPGDNFAAVLLSHRDPATLAWSDTPLLDLPPKIGVPLDVPPWWRMKKKNSMFYVDAGRGDHARIEMAAANLCTDTVEEAKKIDAWFPDVRAYLASIEPPKWPYSIDGDLAQRGRGVFEATCSRCHGTYGEGGRYPNVFLSLDDVGTDPVLAIGGSQFADRFIDWWKKSFYGEMSRLEPKKGYVAPPLDGIWATAPYLHNGSVPTIAQLLDSKTRPKFWTRTFISTDYDAEAIGWTHTALDHGKADEPDGTVRKKLYDTTQLGYANGGHTFGDQFSDSDRRAVLEYLKTL